MNIIPRRNSFSGPFPGQQIMKAKLSINVSTMIIPPFKQSTGQLNHGSAPTLPGKSNGTYIPRKPSPSLCGKSGFKPPFGPGTRRNISPSSSENDALEPLENQLSPTPTYISISYATPEKSQTTGSSPFGLCLTGLERKQEEINFLYIPKDGLAFTREECARKDLDNLFGYYINLGGISTSDQLHQFRIQFETITHYLVSNGYITHLEEFTSSFWNCLSPRVKREIIDPLIWYGDIVLSRNYSIKKLPPYETILQYIFGESQHIDKSETYSPCVTQEEKAPPVVTSPSSESSFQIPHDGQPLETLEPLDNKETEGFGSENESFSDKIPPKKHLLLVPIEYPPENSIPGNPPSLEKLQEKEYVEFVSQNNFHLDNGSVLDSEEPQSPRENLTTFTPKRSGTLKKPTTGDGLLVFPEKFPQLNSTFLDSHGFELIQMDGPEKNSCGVPSHIYTNNYSGIKIIPTTSSTSCFENCLYQKDPGKIKELILQSASVKDHQTKIPSAPTHFSTHQHKFQTFKSPDIIHHSLKPILVSSKNIRGGRAARFIKPRRSISKKNHNPRSIISPPLPLKLKKNNLQFTWFPKKIELSSTLNLHSGAFLK
jgi:hypothetical protein